jgi:DnaJ-class molecular chaperone
MTRPLRKVYQKLLKGRESMFKKITCGDCKGDGQNGEWNEKIEGKPQYVVTDCKSCKGLGTVVLEIIDKRKISKKEKLYYPDSY